MRILPVKRLVPFHIYDGIEEPVITKQISVKHANALMILASYGFPVYQKFFNGNMWFLGRNTAYRNVKEIGFTPNPTHWNKI